jgi:2-methylisocitrate lyase-like PEP mutase family enzyme
MAFVEAPQTEEEVAAVPRLVNGPCLLNVVRGGKTPDIDLRQAEALGYKLAIVPGLLIKSVVGICDKMLSELKSTHRHPSPVKEMTLPDMFRRFGADEWDALRERFRGPLRNATE